MPSFADKTGRTWQLSCTVGDLMRVQQIADVNLALQIAEVASDPLKMALVIWALVQPQAAATGLTADQFYASLGGEEIEQAAGAIAQCVANFSQTGKGDTVSKAIAMRDRINAAAIAKLNQFLDDPETEAKILAEVDRQIGGVIGSFGGSHSD
jgi:hypothetical protein